MFFGDFTSFMDSTTSAKFHSLKTYLQLKKKRFDTVEAC
jgi:hypothetical protein